MASRQIGSPESSQVPFAFARSFAQCFFFPMNRQLIFFLPLFLHSTTWVSPSDVQGPGIPYRSQQNRKVDTMDIFTPAEKVPNTVWTVDLVFIVHGP